MSALFAQGRFWVGWGFTELIIAIIVLIAVFAVLAVYLKHSGVQLPPWLVQIFWIVVAAVVAILAIRFLMSL